ncbi:MAG: patatin-like phospholipase family protein, partial [Crocinitomicaceae bacterium]|nr:patatin-like phospholipase family protein [Crocinitomicaceae bacterium]
MKKKNKLALVLSGGGFNGAFQLGVINYINENWKKITGLSTPMKFDIIAGVSTGALNGSLIAMNKLDLLNDLWIHQIGKNGVTEIYTSDFIDTSSKSDKVKLKIDLRSIGRKLLPELDFKLNFFNKLGLIFSKNKRKQIIKGVLGDIESGFKDSLSKIRSIADNTPLKKKLEKYLDRSAINGTEFLCGFVSLDTGEYHSVMHDEFASEQDFVKGVLASSAIPLIWSPVDSIRFNTQNGTINSLSNVDGGVRNVSPLGDVIKLINKDTEDCHYKIIVINCNSGEAKQKNFAKKSIAAITARSLYDITMTEIFNNDVDHFVKINNLIKQAEAWDNEIVLYSHKKNALKSFDAVIISPH